MRWRRKNREEELDRELRLDLELEAAEQQERGVTAAEARHAAKRALGNTLRVKEDIRETWGWAWVERLGEDLRYGVRVLRKNPVFTLVAVGTLALAIGANTAIFSVMEAVILRPLPYHEPARLVLLAGGTTYTDFQAWKSQSQTFADMAVYYRLGGRSQITLTGNGEPESVQGAFVSSNFLPLLGVPPLIGRWFTPGEEARHERVIVLSYPLWNRRFAARTDVLGKVLRLDGVDWLVVGVMPRSFQFPEAQLWAPITSNRYWGEIIRFDPNYSRYAYARWDVIGRLKPGETFASAQAEMDAIQSRLEQEVPDRNRASRITVVPFRVNLSGTTRLTLYVLFGAVSFLLLIACSNVANLVLARGAARGREMAVRTALGAGRARLVRQMLTESLLLAFLSGCIGAVLAAFGVLALIALAPPDIPRLSEATLNPEVLVFAVAVSILAALLFGMAPALRISRCDPQESLKSGGRGISWMASLARTRGILVVLEFALAVTLLTGAGLLVRSFLTLAAVDPGFEAEHVLTMRVTLPAGTSAGRRLALDELTLERIRSIPGVRAVGAIETLFDAQPAEFGLRAVEGRPPEPQTRWDPLAWTTIRGDYFQAMGARLVQGRFFSAADDLHSPLAAIVDETMARRYWPHESPLGRRFKGFDARGHNDDWLTVIGVVQDMRRHGLEKRLAAHVYQWYKQAPGNATRDLVVRTANDPGTLAPVLRNVVRELDDSAILSRVATMEQELSEQLAPRRFQMLLLSLFASIALVLASAGLYGVVHYSVVQRAQEIGIRMALGAQPANVLRMIAGQGLALAITGLGLGTLGALWLTCVLSGLLYGVGPADPVTFGAVSALLTAVALLASCIPAWRATRLDPGLALRFD
jgi:putative ABC transport system permease protein